MNNNGFQNNSFQKRADMQEKTALFRVVLTGTRTLVTGPNLIHEYYRPAVTSIVIGLNDVFSLMQTTQGVKNHKARPTDIAVIPAGTHCKIKTEGSIAVLTCDAVHDSHSEISLTPRKLASIRKSLIDGPEGLSPTAYLSIIFMQLGVLTNKQIRPDIAQVINAIGREPQLYSNVETAAQLIGLSTARFQHLFTEALGMPFRRYRQWRRMGIVMRALAEGKNLTDAAYLSGFSSSAHLSSAYKAMFGLRPSELLAQHVEYHLETQHH